jgi:hypothetical protein
MAQRICLVLVGFVCFLAGCLLAPHLPFARADDSKPPHWMYGLGLKVRKGSEAEFTKQTGKIGVEVFKDQNNNNLIYISETGSIAVVPAK